MVIYPIIKAIPLLMIYIKKALEEKNIDCYRIWTRDIWLNKGKTYDKLEEFLNSRIINKD